MGPRRWTNGFFAGSRLLLNDLKSKRISAGGGLAIIGLLGLMGVFMWWAPIIFGGNSKAKPASRLVQACHATGPEAPIFLVMGQSNAVGVGKISELSDKTVMSNFAQKGWPFQVGNTESTGWMSGDAIQSMGTVLGVQYFGPELMIASGLLDSGVKDFYIFKHAYVGSFLASVAPNFWGARGQHGHYDQAVADLKKAMADICSQNKRPVIKAMFWMQGESDAMNLTLAERYGKNLDRLISEARQDFLGDTAPIVIGLINNKCGMWPHADWVRGYEARAASKTVGVVETNDLSFYSAPCVDSFECRAHYDSQGQYGLGKRFYQKYLDLIQP